MQSVKQSDDIRMNIVPDLNQSSEAVKKNATVCVLPDIFLPLGYHHHQQQHDDLVPEFLVAWWSQRVDHPNAIISKCVAYACINIACFISIHINCVPKLLVIFFLPT